MEAIQRDKQQKLFEDCVNSLKICAELVNEYSSEDRDAQVKQLKKIAQGYSKADIKSDKINTALKLTAEQINASTGDIIEDVNEAFKKKLEECIVGSTPLEEHRIIKMIHKTLRDGEVKKEIPLNTSLVASQSFHVPIDPITKNHIKVPWRSKICRHVYEQGTTLQYIKLKKGKPVKCPYIGCTNVQLQEVDMFVDEDLLKQIQSTVLNETSLLESSREFQ